MELQKRGHLKKKMDNFSIVTAVERRNAEDERMIYANSDYRKGVESQPAGY
jgi:hypothetical protein